MSFICDGCGKAQPGGSRPLIVATVFEQRGLPDPNKPLAGAKIKKEGRFCSQACVPKPIFIDPEQRCIDAISLNGVGYTFRPQR